MADRALTVTFIGNDAQLNAAFKRVSTQLNGLQRAGSGLQSLGSSLTRNVTLPIVGIGVAAAKMASDFQASMERVHTQAGVSQKAVEQLSAGVLKMAGQVGEAPTELADGMYHVASSLNATLPAAQRVSTELKVLRVAAEGARVGNANLVDVTNALDAAVVAGIKGVQNYQQAMGALNAVVGAGDMSMQDLADALGTGILGPMKTFGLSLQEVGGALAVFGDNNIRGQEAATKLISAVRIMAAPSAKAADALAGVGLKTLTLAKDLRSNGNDGLIIALEDLKKHMEDAGLSATQQGLLIARAFGGRQSTGMQVLLDQLDRLKVKTDDVGKGAQTFGSAWAATQETAAQRTADALAKMKADLTQFGGDVLPTLLNVGSEIVNDVDKVAKDFESLPQALQNTIIKGGLVLATVGPAMKILGLFTSGLGRLYSLVNGKTFAGIVGGGTAGASAASGAAASAASTGVASTVSSGLKLGFSRGLQGLSIAGLGTLVSQTVGTAVHGSVGDAVKKIGTDASIGAGMGAVFGPAGIAGGAVIGGLVGSVTHFITDHVGDEGKKFAAAFTAPLPAAIQKAATAKIATAKNNVSNAQFNKTLAAATPGFTPGSDNPRADAQVAADQAKIQKQFFALGVAAGNATVKGLQSVKDQSSNILLSDFLLQLKKLPGQAQPAAAKTMLDFAIGLEQSGKLPYNSLQTIIKGLEGQIPGFSSYLNNEGQVINQVFSKTLMLSPATATLKSTLAGYRQQFGDWSISTKVTASNIDQTISTAMTHLHDTVATSSGQTRKDALSELGKLHDQTIAMFNNMGDKVQTSIKNMSTAIKDGSASAAKVASTNLGSFAANVQQAMSSSVISAGQGMKLIIDNTNKALKEMGQKQLSPIQVGELTLGIGKQQQLVGHAGGGMVQFGRHGDKGRDTIPVNFGGAHIAVGSGEVGMVANHDQQAFLNARTADVGGLSGVFSKFNRPHYMASGGMVPGFATGGALGYGQLEGLWEQGGGPPSVASIAAAIALAESSGQDVMQQGQPFATTGWGYWQITPGGPQYLDPLTNARAAVAKYRGAGDTFQPWTTYNDGAYKQFLHGGVAASAATALQKIMAPAVNGSGAIANVVKGALGKTAAAANAFLAKLTPTISGGAGGFSAAGLPAAGGGFDPSQLGSYNGVPVAKWIIPELNWARGHGWVGSVTSGWRSPTAVVHGEFATAPQGQSEHQYDIYPGGAVDVSDYQQFAQIIQGYPGAEKLIQLGIDPLHFSGTGHARGGLVGPLPFAGSFDKGGTIPGRVGQPMLGVVHGGEHVIPHMAKGGMLGAKITFSGTENVIGGLGSVPSQGIGAQIQLAQLSNAVSTAQNTGNVNAQKAALQKEMKYEKSWLSADKKQLKKVNSLLSKRGLSRKQRGQLLQDKLALIQEIGTIEGDIGGISSSLSDLATSTTPDSTDSSGTDTSGDSGSGDSDVVDALNALTDAIQAQTQAEAALQATLQAQNAYMSSAGAVETKQAIKAFSDVISGQIGGRYLSRATGSAGDGSVARY